MQGCCWSARGFSISFGSLLCAGPLQHVVVVSVLTADLTDTVFGKQFAELEAHVKSAGIPYTLLRLPIFLDNQYGNIGSIKGQSTWYDGIEPEKPFTPGVVSGEWGHLLPSRARVTSSQD